MLHCPEVCIDLHRSWFQRLPYSFHHACRILLYYMLLPLFASGYNGFKNYVQTTRTLCGGTACEGSPRHPNDNIKTRWRFESGGDGYRDLCIREATKCPYHGRQNPGALRHPGCVEQVR